MTDIHEKQQRDGGTEAIGTGDVGAAGAINTALGVVAEQTADEIKRTIGVQGRTPPAVQRPSIGRIVHYRVTAAEATRSNARREWGLMFFPKALRPRYAETPLEAGAVVPVMVTGVHQTGWISGVAFLDGDDTLWIGAATEGDKPGAWFWPPRS